MKYVSEFRDPLVVERGLEALRQTITRPWVLMEICGGQTHAIVRSGLDQLLPPEIELVHGPGCPVCVTPVEQIDKALAIASRPEVIFTSYGDMLRVPGSQMDLFSVRAAGGDVRVVYSPLDAVRLAEAHPDRQVVFFAIGFETTAPANAMSVLQAHAKGLKNFSVLVSHVRVPPAMCAILGSPTNRVQGFLAAGHVCAVMGHWEYPPIAETFHVPIVVTPRGDPSRAVQLTPNQSVSVSGLGRAARISPVRRVSPAAAMEHRRILNMPAHRNIREQKGPGQNVQGRLPDPRGRGQGQWGPGQEHGPGLGQDQRGSWQDRGQGAGPEKTPRWKKAPVEGARAFDDDAPAPQLREDNRPLRFDRPAPLQPPGESFRPGFSPGRRR